MNSTLPLTEPDRAKMRVAIAKDVIQRLDDRRLIAETGSFVEVMGIHDNHDNGDIRSMYTSLRSVIADHPCEVCALGGLMVGMASVNGDLDLNSVETIDYGILPYIRRDFEGYDDERDGTTFAPYLLTYFDVKQLQLIEVAYERGQGAFNVRWLCEEPMDRYDMNQWDKLTRAGLMFSLDEARAAFSRYDHHESNIGDESRLRDIMLNVIHNEGTFVVSDPFYVESVKEIAT